MTIDPQALTLRSKIIGSMIRDARQHRERSIKDCAETIGIAIETFEAYENGTSSPSLPELEGLAYYLEVPLENFFQGASISAAESQRKMPEMKKLVGLRQRMIGAILRQARIEADVSLEKLSDYMLVDTALLEEYELGQEPIPLPHLEVLSGALSRSIREFQDKHGPVGVWITEQQAIQDFKTMPPELQEFVSKPINRPYLDLAVRLSEMSVDRLRSVAEGLLEITY